MESEVEIRIQCPRNVIWWKWVKVIEGLHGSTKWEEVMMKEEEKDLGVIVQDTLTSEGHMYGIFASIYRSLTNIRVTFNDMDKIMIKTS